MSEQLPPRIQPVSTRTLFHAAKHLDSRKLPLHARAIAERLAELQRKSGGRHG